MHGQQHEPEHPRLHRADGEQCGSLGGTGGAWSDLDFVAELCAGSVSYFALQEGPQHFPRVLLSDKVNRIKKMLPNAF